MQKSSLAKIPEVDVKLELDETPTREETKKATMRLKVGKSPGIDSIPAEVYQQGEAVFDKLQDLFTNCWEKGTLPQDLRDDSHCLSVQKVSFGTKMKEKNQTVQTLEASLSSPLLAKFWLASC